jgi:hypothetical protein
VQSAERPQGCPSDGHAAARMGAMGAHVPGDCRTRVGRSAAIRPRHAAQGGLEPDPEPTSPTPDAAVHAG